MNSSVAAAVPVQSTEAGRIVYIRRLENESIYIFRDVVAECRALVLLYSIGKDSTVMLHLARTAFHPSPLRL
jgi:sulfate adenylyltransferase subunit 2